MWLALTGARLKTADCLVAGVATHFVEASRLDELKQTLRSPLRCGEGKGGEEWEALAHFASDPGAPRELTPENIDRIDRIFALGSVEAIVAALDEEGSDWAKAQLATLATKSPQTLKVAFRQLREGAIAPDFAAQMAREYRVACRVVQRHDFLEGVRALIVDKDNKPAWSPSELAGVTEAMLDEIFAPLAALEEWRPLA
jgi:enoyl-CoA hydratase